MKVLLHICCGPCACACLPALRQDGHEVAGFWYNPNVHPYGEYEARLEAARKAAEALGVELIEGGGYGLVEFLRLVAHHESGRCALCYRMRLLATAKEAVSRGFDGFATTIACSPHQDLALCRELGEQIALALGLTFVEPGLRKHFSDGMRKSRELGLYRQTWCGCVYSEWERHGGRCEEQCDCEA